MLKSVAPASIAVVGYLVIALALTWPLARGLGRDVPADLGDSLFVMWVIAWDAEQLGAIAGGDVARIPGFFDANIFHPAPLALAYSEHLFAQGLQAWPVYLASRNPILCYNLLFLSTFVLSGLGVFLLVRELTGSACAGFVAGVLFAFAPYRAAQLGHLQVLSAQWMPFALYGLQRYFATRAIRPLAGAATAITLQNLSSAYYLFYFAPILALYAAWELTRHTLWRDRRTWTHLSLAAAAVAAVTVPFLLPYKHLHDTLQFAWPRREIVRYSADVYSYFTAAETSAAWGSALRVYPKPEGHLFPGVVPLLLASVAAVAWIAGARRHLADAPPRAPRWLLVTIAAAACVYGGLALVAIFSRRIDFDVGLLAVRATNLTRLLLVPLVAAGLLLWAAPSLRGRAARLLREPEAIYVAALVLAWWLSLGPSPHVLGRPLEIWSPYGLLMAVVPGFDGLRVPARFAMIVVLALSVLAGLAAARLVRGRWQHVVFVALCAVSLAEARLPEFPINRVAGSGRYAAPPPRVHRPGRAPAVYRELARTAPHSVVMELPIGDPAHDIRAVYYSTAHWRPLVNGYSGFYPPHYDHLLSLLSDVALSGDEAWVAIERLGVTHVIVHERAYLGTDVTGVLEWLRGHGAHETFRDAGDVLFELKR